MTVEVNGAHGDGDKSMAVMDPHYSHGSSAGD